MSVQLVLEEIELTSGLKSRAEISRLDKGSYSIGREPENHIVVDSEAISRSHGRVHGGDAYWVYQDLESTNGSWINGNQIPIGQMRLVRDGDILQLANFVMRARYVGDLGGAPAKCAVVFFHDRLLREAVLDVATPRFVLGGAESELVLDGGNIDLPNVIIATEGNKLLLDVINCPLEVTHNGTLVVGRADLVDRDEVRVGLYRIIVCDAASAIYATESVPFSSEVSQDVHAYDRPHLPEHLQPQSTNDWESESIRRKNITGQKFVLGQNQDVGQVVSTFTGTMPSLHAGQIGGARRLDLSTSHRFTQVAINNEEEITPERERFLVIIGVIAFIAVAVFVSIFFL